MAFFERRAHVQDALTRLAALGVGADRVTVLPERAPSPGEFGVYMGSHAGPGATTGGLVGAIIGGLAGAAFAGASVIALGQVIAGPAVSAIFLAGVLGVVGALVGAIAGSQSPRYHAGLTADPTRAGTLVAVRSLGDLVAIEGALRAAGAAEVRAHAL